MVVYRFRISFEDFDGISREIDIKTTQTFEDLHIAFHKSTGYNPNKPSSFYVSTDNWLKGEEIALMPSEKKIERGVTLMSDSKIKKFIEDPHQKFYYIYNFERSFDFHVELIDIILNANEQLSYPHISKSIGEAPKIFDSTNAAAIAATAATAKSTEFDFLNELDFVPEDVEELESLSGSGINEKSGTDDDSDEYDSEEGQEDEEGYEDEYGSGSDRDEDY